MSKITQITQSQQNVSRADILRCNNEIAKATLSLMLSRPFYGLFLNTLNKVHVDDPHIISTMGVGLQGINYKLYNNISFWGSLNDTEKEFLLSHEVMHIMLGHVEQSKNFYDQRLHNIATDLYINHTLLKAMGKGAVRGNLISKIDWEDQYVPLMKEIGEKYKNKEITYEEYQSELRTQIPLRGIVPQDYPELTEEDIEKGSSHIYNLLDDLLDEDAKENMNPQSKHNGWEDISGLSKEELELISDQVTHITQKVTDEVNKSQGNIPNEFKGIIDAMLQNRKSSIPWGAALKKWGKMFGNFKGVKKTFKRPHLIIPGAPKNKLTRTKHLAFVLDTSGSMSRDDILRGMELGMELKKETRAKITVIECDARVSPEGIYELKSVSQVEKRMQEGMVTGGGGTNVMPAIEYLKENPIYTGLIYFTDGYVPNPKSTYGIDMLTVVTEDGKPIANMSDNEWNTPLIQMNDKKILKEEQDKQNIKKNVVV